MGFKVGDLVKDITEPYGDAEFIGVIEDIVFIFGQRFFHVKYFGYDECIPVSSDEIVKVS
jgi:hypothetical protein